MLPVRALLVDFDGTACVQDVSEMHLDTFGEPGWERFDEAVDRGEMGLREAGAHQVATRRGSREEMLAFALSRSQRAPCFATFVGWVEDQDLPLVLASAFYIRPILEEAGLGHVEMVTNELVFEGPALSQLHPNGHPVCIGCGTCKMLAAQRLRERHGPVAFVGDGQSDRYGALYSDIVFAKDALVAICELDGAPFRRWETFDDVREGLETIENLAGPLGGERCPGWRSP
jgi:2-hydroxy-3-keto-5-methylthiopentenyl-1-phosphate phosphatase